MPDTVVARTGALLGAASSSSDDPPKPDSET
jgi:hypothetical protein